MAEDSAHELGPSAIVRSGYLPGTACRWLVLHLRASEPNDLAPPFGVRREHTMIDDEVHLGARNLSRELFEKLQGLKGNVTRAVAPRRLEAHEHASIGGK